MVYHALDVEGVISCWPAGHGTATAPDDCPGALSGTVVIAETNPDHRDRREHRASSPRRRPDPAETSSPSTTEPHPHVVTLNARQHPGKPESSGHADRPPQPARSLLDNKQISMTSFACLDAPPRANRVQGSPSCGGGASAASLRGCPPRHAAADRSGRAERCHPRSPCPATVSTPSLVSTRTPGPHAL